MSEKRELEVKHQIPVFGKYLDEGEKEQILQELQNTTIRELLLGKLGASPDERGWQISHKLQQKSQKPR